MFSGSEWRAALAVAAAAAGAGFASGRETALFFAQLGWAGWPGIPFACLLFGLLCGGLAHFARRAGARSLPGLCRAQLGPRWGNLAGLLHALLMAMTAAVMTVSAGELGALALPSRHGFTQGAALALLLALMVNMGGLKRLPWLGLAALVVGLCFYAGLAVDPRPVRLYQRSETTLALRGNLAAGALLAAFWAALNACAAGGVIVRFARGGLRPGRFGALCGGVLCALLLCTNAALSRGGEALLAQALPTVILAARWGTAGFYLSAGFAWLCALTTLTAALAALADQLRDGRGLRRGALMALALAALAAALFGLRDVIGRAYPAAGWACAFGMAALACRFDGAARRNGAAAG